MRRSRGGKPLASSPRLAADHAVFVSSRLGRLRVSLAGYNDSGDLERLVEGLAVIGSSSPS
jgi:hypothetical protein